eukprot:IDg9396t1
MDVHDTATLRSQSTRLLLALSAAEKFDVWTSNVLHAYLQPEEPLSRDLFIVNPAPEFEMPADKCLQLLKPLYGLKVNGKLEGLSGGYVDDFLRTGSTEFRVSTQVGKASTRNYVLCISINADAASLAGKHSTGLPIRDIIAR